MLISKQINSITVRITSWKRIMECILKFVSSCFHHEAIRIDTTANKSKLMQLPARENNLVISGGHIFRLKACMWFWILRSKYQRFKINKSWEGNGGNQQPLLSPNLS